MTASSQPLESRPPQRCLVIQLARLGDTVQSLMALRAVKQLYPSLEIHVVARERFASALKRIPWIQSVTTLPTDSLLGPVLKKEKTQQQMMGEMARWVGPLTEGRWEYLVNWTFSEASSYLSALIPARVKLGYTRRKDGTFAAADGWSHYVQAIVQGGVTQNIHLTDILTTQLLTALQIHIGDPIPNGDAPVTSKTFFTLALDRIDRLKTLLSDDSKKWIGIQVSSDKEESSWTPENQAKFIQYVFQRNPGWNVLLLGNHKDEDQEKKLRELVAPLVSERKQVLSLVGETDFDTWACAISRCQWMVAGDSAAVHLASVLGTRVMMLSMEKDRFLEIGPYGNGHYVIATDSSVNGSISPEAAYGVWAYAANEWVHRRQTTLESHFCQLGWQDQLSPVRIYRSRIRNSQDGGGAAYDLMNKGCLLFNEWTAMIMGYIARSWYCGWVPSVGQELSRDIIDTALVQKIRPLQEVIAVLSQICEQASQTALQLNKKTSNMKSQKVMGVQDREELRNLGATLADLENLLDRLAKTNQPFEAFSQMSKVLMHNLKGSQLAELGQETSNCYKQLNEGVQIFGEWIKFTLELAKPIAIKSNAPATLESLVPLSAEKETTP